MGIRTTKPSFRLLKKVPEVTEKHSQVCPLYKSPVQSNEHSKHSTVVDKSTKLMVSILSKVKRIERKARQALNNITGAQLTQEF